MLPNHIYLNLSSYDKAVLKGRTAQAIHNNLIAFNNAFFTSNADATDYIEIVGCETPIYMVLREEYVTFVCRSKVLRSYIFCVLINYIYSEDFNFKHLIMKYSFDNFLTPSRIQALENLTALLENLPRDYLINYLDIGEYRLDTKQASELYAAQ